MSSEGNELSEAIEAYDKIRKLCLEIQAERDRLLSLVKSARTIIAYFAPRSMVCGCESAEGCCPYCDAITWLKSLPTEQER